MTETHATHATQENHANHANRANNPNPETRVNVELLVWCVVVLLELVIITALSGLPLVLLFAAVLYWPVKDAMAWPVSADQARHSGQEKTS